MEYILGREGSSTGNDGAAGRVGTGRSPDLIEFPHKRGTAHAVDRTVHAAPTAELRICRIHDRIHANVGDVADHQPQCLSVREFGVHARYSKGWTAGKHSCCSISMA